MIERQEFPSSAWLQMLADRWRSHAAKLEPGTKLSISETYTNVPPHLAGNTQGTVSWTCRVDSPNVRFSTAAAEDVDLRVEADYAFVKKLVRLVITPENQDHYQNLAAAAFNDGGIRVWGDISIATLAQDLHNEVAERTR
jgi:hypothetical protein